MAELLIPASAIKSLPSTAAQSVLRQKYKTAITRTVAVLVFLGVWELVVDAGWVNPLFLSAPSTVMVRLVEVFADGSIWPHIIASGTVAFWGFLLSIVIGIPIGVLMGRSLLVRNTLEPFIMAQASAPTVAFLPLLIIWLGIGMGSKVALVFAGAVFIIIISAEAGVRSVDRRLVETARSFTATEMETLIKVVAPAALPFILAGMRLTISRVLIMVVVAEFYTSSAGLGYLIFQAGSLYDTPMIFVGVVILAGTGVILNSLLREMEKRVAPWMQTEQVV